MLDLHGPDMDFANDPEVSYLSHYADSAKHTTISLILDVIQIVQ